ncbi:MAG: oxygen-independent coproporphyrinogen III oxidase [Methylococcaceae bacterium]
MDQSIQFDLDLINRYDKAGPRYTSYPTALELHEGFGDREYRQHIATSNAAGGPLSLYFHIPFCDTVCFYCACNKIVTKNRKHAEPYLANLCKEIAMQGDLFDSSRVVNQLHWGGGTPTFLSYEQMLTLMAATRQHFQLRDDDKGEYSIEVDPRETNDHTIKQLRELGFNRVSLGLQDFDPAVQKAVNRLQSEEQTFSVLAAARAEGFRSTNIDLIYGLPLQTVETFARTLDKILAVEPDRFSIFNYAHMPARFKTQRQINDADMPTPDVKLAILQMVGQRLTEAGYVYIGMDHFARPNDELAVAQRNKHLQRNFQGYSTRAGSDIYAFGMSGVSQIPDAYWQNEKELPKYQEAVDAGRVPLHKAYFVTAEDKIRRETIMRTMCDLSLDFAAMSQKLGINFEQHFASELASLAPFEADGLVKRTLTGLEITDTGRLFIRNIAMCFDNTLAPAGERRHSRTI